MNKCERCGAMRVENGGCLACGMEHPDDALFTGIKEPGIFLRSSLTMHVAYSGPQEDASAHVAVRMPKGCNILLLQPAIEMALATFCKSHPDGFEAALEHLSQGAMHVAGHTTTRNSEDLNDGQEIDPAGK